VKRLLLLLCLAVFGCGTHVSRNPDPVEVEGRVTLKSKPLTGVTVNLQPTGSGAQASLPVKNGKFKGSVTPGTYTYYLSEGTSAADFKAIPEKYREGSMDRQVEITAAQSLTLTLD